MSMRSDCTKELGICRVRVFCVALAWILLLGIGAPAPAQEAPGTRDRAVEGTVTHRDGEPVRGAAVQLEDMRTLEVRSYLTHEDGRYHFDELYTNVDYQLKAEFHGTFGPVKTLSRFDSRKTAKIDLRVASP